MKITAIRAQIKRAGRYSVYVDGKYEFSLSENSLLESGVAKDQELDTAQLRELKKLSADDKLYGRVLDYLALRPRSVWEVETYLRRKKAPEELADKIIGKLSRLKLVDDREFARKWVDDRRLLKPTSKRKLRLELRAKRVCGEIITEVLEDDTATDREILRELIARKRLQPRYRDELKLMQYLARQGFGYGDIKEALNTEEEDWV